MVSRIPFLHNTKNHRAQGMAEFALVLPLLLLVIFGIISFGHLFFNYILVVASAREAARYGIATGLSERNLPRFRDCDGIRDAAIRAGSYAGVSLSAVTISYDKGPVTPPSTPVSVGDCPIGGIGPGNVQIGDRIVITVSVNYVPIVPVGFIPKIPLTAVVQRTLIRSMPIDDQAVSQGGGTCNINTITRILPPGWDPNNPVSFSTSSFGQQVTFQVQVIDDTPQDTNYATGKVYLFVDDPNYTPGNQKCTGDTSNALGNIWTCAPISDMTVGTHYLYAEFVPDPSSCYQASSAVQWEHIVQ